jgi:hypothetical protein
MLLTNTLNADQPPRGWSFSSRTESVLPTVTSYIDACPDRFFVTLTTKRSLDGYGLSAAIGRLLHQVNRTLFGTAYTRHKRLFMASLVVFEETFAQQLHAHCMFGVPEGSLGHKPNRTWTTLEGLIKSVWCSMDHGGRPNGQDLQRIESFAGVCSYVQKGLWDLGSLDRVDLPNTRIPPVPARSA